MDSEKYIEAYIGKDKTSEKSLNWYKDSFHRGDISDGLSWKWSWWAFFGNWLYLLYRKCYKEGIIYFIIINIIGKSVGYFLPELTKSISGGSLFIGILSGGLLHNIIYRRYRNTKKSLEEKFELEEDLKKGFEKNGGTDRKAVIIGVIAYFVINKILNF
jgi:hypothetical protein